MQEDPKPVGRCPYCGSAGIVREDVFDLPGGRKDTMYFVECALRECGNRTRLWYPKSSAVAAWNRRPVEGPADLREALDRLYALQSGLCQEHCGTAADRGIHTDGCRAAIRDLDTIGAALVGAGSGASLGAPLRWTREKPTREGWYFFRPEKWPHYYFPVYIRAIVHDRGIQFFIEESTEEYVKDVDPKGLKGEWAGLLPDPQGEANAERVSGLPANASQPEIELPSFGNLPSETISPSPRGGEAGAP